MRKSLKILGLLGDQYIKSPSIFFERIRFCSYSFLCCIAFLFLVVLVFPQFARGQEAWPTAEKQIPETRISGQLISHKLYLGTNFPAAYGSTVINTVRSYKKFYIEPEKGTLTGQGQDGGGHYVTYKPFLHAEGEDSFTWTAQDVVGRDKNFTYNLQITPTPDALEVYVSNLKQEDSMNLSLVEEQNLVAQIEIFDPDPNLGYDSTVPENWPQVSLSGNDEVFFSTNS